VDECFAVAGDERADRAFEPREERAIADRAVLDHLGETGAKLAVGERREAIDVDQHGARLPERADHVLAERMVDAGLAADRGIDLRKQRRRNLDERNAALVDRRGEASEIADDAAAERDQERPALGAEFEQARQQVVERRGILVRLAVRNEHGVDANPGGVEALSQRREVQARHDGVRHDDGARATGERKSRCRFAQKAAADVDRVASLAETDVDGDHVAPAASDAAITGSGVSLSQYAKRIAASRSDSTTWWATSR
jgi:hypothetical protein